MPTLFDLRHRTADQNRLLSSALQDETVASQSGEDVIRDCRSRLAPKDFVESKLNELQPYANAFGKPANFEETIVWGGR